MEIKEITKRGDSKSCPGVKHKKPSPLGCCKKYTLYDCTQIKFKGRQNTLTVKDVQKVLSSWKGY